jgi:hypothetical protein
MKERIKEIREREREKGSKSQRLRNKKDQSNTAKGLLMEGV